MVINIKKAISASCKGKNLYSQEEQQQWLKWIKDVQRLATMDAPATKPNLFTQLLPGDYMQIQAAKKTAFPLPVKIKTRVLVPCFVIRRKRYVVIRPDKSSSDLYWLAKVIFFLTVLFVIQY